MIFRFLCVTIYGKMNTQRALLARGFLNEILEAARNLSLPACRQAGLALKGRVSLHCVQGFRYTEASGAHFEAPKVSK